MYLLLQYIVYSHIHTTCTESLTYYFVHIQEVEIFASSSALTNNLMKAVFNFVKVNCNMYCIIMLY